MKVGAAVRRADQRTFLALSAVAIVVFGSVTTVPAAVTFTTQHGAGVHDFDAMISSTDLIHGRQTLDVDVFENPMDSFGKTPLPGWHPANTNPADQIAAFTDGAGMLASGLTGLLNDANVPDPSGKPAKIVEYPFDTPVDIGRIHILTGNRNNADSRIFSTVYVEYSTNNGGNYTPLGYFQSDPSGTINDESNPASTFDPPQKSTFMSIFDNSSPTLVSGVTNIIFNLYAVGADNDPLSPTRGIHGDPFDGTSAITNIDDGIRSAFVSPLVLEIDVLAPQAGVPGDYNSNGVVDAADYVVWRDNVNAATLPNRVSGITGPVGQADYDAWRARFGNTSGVGSVVEGAAVPEPTSLVLVLGALTGLMSVRRGSRAPRSRRSLPAGRETPTDV